MSKRRKPKTIVPLPSEVVDGRDHGPSIRIGRDVEVVTIRDLTVPHSPTARSVATVRVGMASDVLLAEWRNARRIEAHHVEAGRRFQSDHEIGVLGAVVRAASGQGATDRWPSDARIDALTRFNGARDAMIRSDGAHDVAIYILLKNVSISNAADRYHREVAGVHAAFLAALDVLVSHYNISLDLDDGTVDPLAV